MAVSDGERGCGMSNTLAQERSLFALKELDKRIPEREKFAKLVLGLPAMILQNGLGQTLAFLLSKGTDKNGKIDGNDRHIVAFHIMVGWLNKRGPLRSSEPGDAVKALSGVSQQEYLYAQDEAMKVLEWVKRYANAGLFTSQGG